MEDELLYIDSFFNNELTENERREFERRCETDKVFAENVALYIKTKYGFKKLQNTQRKVQFEQIRKNYDKPIMAINRGTYWLAAASVVLMCFVGWWFISKPNLEQLADGYLQENFMSLSSTMSSEKDSLQEGIKLFNEGKLPEANDIFEVLATKSNPEALKYAGIACLRQQNYAKAIEQFEALEKLPLKVNAGTFYHAIVLLKRHQNNDLDEAKKLLEKVKTEKLEGWEDVEKWNL